MSLLAPKPIVNDTVDGLLGLALIGGLFSAYYIQRRNARLAREAEQRAIAEPETPSGPSPSFGVSFMYTVLLIAAGTHPHSGWGYLWQALFGVMFVLAVGTTFSRGAWEGERAKAPALTRRAHMLMNGVLYVLLPLIGWVLVVPVGWLWGALAPGVIWLVPFVGSIAVEAYEAIRGPKR